MRGEPRRLRALVDRNVTGEIGVAGMPGDIVHAPDIRFAVQLAGYAIGWRRRAGDAEQWENVREIRPVERKPQIQACRLERVLNAALDRQSRAAIGDLKIDRVGLVRFTQHQRRTADKLQQQGLALEPACERQFGLRFGAGLTRRRSHRPSRSSLRLASM